MAKPMGASDKFIPSPNGKSLTWLQRLGTNQVIGMQSQTGGAYDIRFVPVRLTAGEIASPSAYILGNTDVTYQLDVSPFTRYRSDGTNLLVQGDYNPASVAITGGTITGVTFNNSTIGATTPTTGIFTTLQAQTSLRVGTTAFYGAEQASIRGAGGLTIQNTTVGGEAVLVIDANGSQDGDFGGTVRGSAAGNSQQVVKIRGASGVFFDVGGAGSPTGAGRLDSGGLALITAGSVSWAATTLIATTAPTLDVRLFRDAAAILALRNSTTAQTYRTYVTYTDSSNGEWLSLKPVAGTHEIAAESNGTGSSNIDLKLTAKGTGGVTTTSRFSPATAGGAALGAASVGFSKLYLDYTNTTPGTTGAQTINKPTGRVNIAAGGTSVVVTNSLVTTATEVYAICATNDTTAQVKNVVSGSGSFTINLSAAATAETAVAFFVVNTN